MDRERTLPHLVAYGDDGGDCDPAELREIIDAGWSYLIGENLGDEIPTLIENAKRSAPAVPEGSSGVNGASPVDLISY